mmetsp:Transcript_3331/g.6259  ORF Transcript_3331/g.6259 Transcript_3331/m.6259 type:complete len:213 (-) Transcript_3331:97-735(-)
MMKATMANGMGRAVARVSATSTSWLSSSPPLSSTLSSLAWDPRLTSMYQQQALDPRFNLFCRPTPPAPTISAVRTTTAAPAPENHYDSKPTAQDILSTVTLVVERHEQPVEAIKTEEETVAIAVVVSKSNGLSAKQRRQRDQRRKLFHKRRRYFSVLIGRSAREMQQRIVQRQYRDGPMAELLTTGYQTYLANKLYQQNKDSLVQLLVQMRR